MHLFWDYNLAIIIIFIFYRYESVSLCNYVSILHRFRSFNAIFGKTRLVASDIVIVELLNKVCLPSLLYGLEAFPLKLNSLDYVLIGTFVKFLIAGYEMFLLLACYCRLYLFTNTSHLTEKRWKALRNMTETKYAIKLMFVRTCYRGQGQNQTYDHTVRYGKDHCRSNCHLRALSPDCRNWPSAAPALLWRWLERQASETFVSSLNATRILLAALLIIYNNKSDRIMYGTTLCLKNGTDVAHCISSTHIKRF